MKIKYDVYGRKFNEWFYVDTFSTHQGAIEGIKRMLKDSDKYRAFAKYYEYKVQETYTWA